MADGVVAKAAVTTADDLVASAAQFRVHAQREACEADGDAALLEETLPALFADN